MPNHPNRSTNHPSRNPSPEEVTRTRINQGLSVSQACVLVHTTPRTWQQWERGDRRMHPAFWELFSIKLKSVAVGAA